MEIVKPNGEKEIEKPLMSPEEEYSAQLSGIDNKEIEKAFKDLEAQDKISKAANAKRAEVRARMSELGVKSPDLNAAYARWKMDEPKRRKRDLALAKCNEAMGMEYQNPLFGADGSPTATKQ